MALMHEEVYLALRSVMPEDKALEGAARLHRAVSGQRDRPMEQKNRLETGANPISETDTPRSLFLDLENLRIEISALRKDLLILKWMYGTSAVLLFISMLKVFSEP